MFLGFVRGLLGLLGFKALGLFWGFYIGLLGFRVFSFMD